MSLHPTIVHLHGPRGDELEAVLGTRDLRVLSPIPVPCELPGFATPQHCYLLDVAELTAEQQERLIAHMSKKFGLPVQEVEAEMIAYGVPLLEDGCSVTFDMRLL